jgi:hypothetical protein
VGADAWLDLGSTVHFSKSKVKKERKERKAILVTGLGGL